MEKLVNAWVLGGDGRYTWAARSLRRFGLPVKCRGVPELENQGESLEAALRDADIVLLPMKPFRGETLCVAGEEIPGALLPMLLSKGALVAAGQLPEPLEAWYRENGLRCFSYLEDESFQLRNANTTAEGAIYLLLHHSTRTVDGMKLLVLGAGRIGGFLAAKLRAMGAKVTVTTRNAAKRTDLELRGYETLKTGEYPQGLEIYDGILNTVPRLVISEEQAESIREDCLCIELASDPGGFPDCVENRVISGRFLPGRTFPETAGEHLAAAVWDALAGEGRMLE